MASPTAAGAPHAFGLAPGGGEMRAHFAVFLVFRNGRIAEHGNYDCFEPF